MSNFDQVNYRAGSEPRHRRMSRYDSDMPVREPAVTREEAPVQDPEVTDAAPQSGDTTRAPKVYGSYQETEATRRTRATNDALLEQRSRAFEKQAQHTGVYTRMTQTEIGRAHV